MTAGTKGRITQTPINNNPANIHLFEVNNRNTEGVKYVQS